MNITIRDERTQKAEKVSFSGKTVQELLAQVSLNPETVLIIRNDKVISESEPLQEGDVLDILSVVSGG